MKSKLNTNSILNVHAHVYSTINGANPLSHCVHGTSRSLVSRVRQCSVLTQRSETEPACPRAKRRWQQRERRKVRVWRRGERPLYTAGRYCRRGKGGGELGAHECTKQGGLLSLLEDCSVEC